MGLPRFGLLSVSLSPVIALLLLSSEAFLGGFLLFFLFNEVSFFIFERLLGLSEVRLGSSKRSPESGVGAFEVSNELLETLLGGGFSRGVLFERGLERGSELFHLFNNISQFILVNA